MALSPHLKTSRNIVRLAVAVVLIGFIMRLQALSNFNPDLDDTDSKPSSGVPPAPAPDRAGRVVGSPSAKINPGQFRLEIIMLERLLYNMEPKFDDGWTVEVRSDILADSLLAYRNDDMKTRAGIAIRRFSADAGRAMDAGYPRGPRWEEWRKDWQSLRRQFFADADWYQNHDPTGVPVASPRGPVPLSDRAAVQDLDDFAVALSAAVGRGLESALKIPETPNEFVAQTTEGRAMTKKWTDWVARWDREVDSLARRHATTVSSTADPHVVIAGQELGTAVNTLRVSSVTVAKQAYPSKEVRRDRFDSAKVHVERARYHLSRIGTPAK